MLLAPIRSARARAAPWSGAVRKSQMRRPSRRKKNSTKTTSTSPVTRFPAADRPERALEPNEALVRYEPAAASAFCTWDAVMVMPKPLPTVSS